MNAQTDASFFLQSDATSHPITKDDDVIPLRIKNTFKGMCQEDVNNGLETTKLWKDEGVVTVSLQ